MNENEIVSSHAMKFDERQFFDAFPGESDNNYEFIYANFGNLCRFCLKMRSNNVNVNFHEIFLEDESETNNLLIQKINFTLYENASEKVDFKISNIVCGNCLEKIDNFYNFKKQCQNSSNLLHQVKNEIEAKAQIKSEVFEVSVHEETVQETNFRVMTSKDIDNEADAGGSEDSENNDFNDETEESEDEDETENMDDDFDSEKKSPTSKVKREKSKSDTMKKMKTRKQYKGKLHQCQICGKMCKGIQMHMLTHTGEKKYNCYMCSKSFTQSGQLKRHINSHLDIRNYKCEICDRRFVDPSSVTKHMVVHNKEDRKFICTLCGARFNRLGALRYHEKTHRQERNHVCDICSKSFLAKYDLTKHYRIHTGEKPYKCQYCDKRFTISKNAKVHMRVHTKEKPYNCNFCDLAFSYRSSLKNHLVKIHNHTDVPALPLLQHAISIAMRETGNTTNVDQMDGQLDNSTHIGMPSIQISNEQQQQQSNLQNSAHAGMTMIPNIDRN